MGEEKKQLLSLYLFPFIWGSKVSVSGRVERPAVSAAPQPAGCLLSLRSSPIYHHTRYQEQMDVNEMERSIYLGLQSDGRATGADWCRRAAEKQRCSFRVDPSWLLIFMGLL